MSIVLGNDARCDVEAFRDSLACVTINFIVRVRVVQHRLFMTAVMSLLATACALVVGIEDPDVRQTSLPVSNDSGGPKPVVDAADGPKDAGIAPDLPDVDASSAKFVFVTSDKSNGILNGWEGADARCIAAANRASLPGKWLAWISVNGKPAIDRIIHDGPYLRLDKFTVVSNKAQLTSGALTSPINVNELKQLVSDANPEDIRVWTGTFSNGQPSVDCDDWRSANPLVFGGLGQLNRIDGSWTDNGGPGGGFRHWGCQTTAHVYCFQE
jgi:hypothetical protein